MTSKELYGQGDKKIMKAAADSLNPKVDRIQEIIAYAKEAGIKKLGIANCIAFRKETEELTNQLKENGFEVSSVNCKYDKMNFNEIIDGYKGVSCNPAGQAAYLAEKETELNIMMGLCIGHDMIFNAKSVAPVTPIVVKDRKEKHYTIGLLSDKNQD